MEYADENLENFKHDTSEMTKQNNALYKQKQQRMEIV